MNLFSPVTDLSNVGILIENCLEDNEDLVKKYFELPIVQETRGDGSVFGDAVFLWEEENDSLKSLFYNELHAIMLKASSIFVEKNNKTMDNYSKRQTYYKIVRWSPPQDRMNAHADGWEVDGKPMVPAITNLLYLTSDFEGGELHFPDHDITFKPKAGDVVSFFSNTRHEVRPVFSGRRVTTQLFLFDK